MKTVKRLIEELDDWAFIGIDSDIYECKSQRPEYQPLVAQAESLGFSDKDITNYVLTSLKEELLLPWYKRPTQRHCLMVWFKNLIRRF